VGDRRHDVDRPDHGVVDSTIPLVRVLDQQGDAGDVAGIARIGRPARLSTAVADSVIRGEDHERVVVLVGAAQLGDQAPDETIDVADLKEMALEPEARRKGVGAPGFPVEPGVVRTGVDVLLPSREVLPGHVRQGRVHEVGARAAALGRELAK
jgi:hypothetical protein